MDTLLPLTGMAAVAFAVYVSKSDADRPSVYCAIPLLFLVSQIKNSGIFFLVFAAAVLLLTVRKKADLFQRAVVCVCPFVGMYLWSQHCDYVFAQASSSKHALAIENFSKVFLEKGLEDILRITKGVLEYALTRQGLLFLLLWLVVLGAVAWIAGNKKRFAEVTLCTVLMYGIYTVGVIGMYLFSMPLSEAFASMERYMRTIDIAAYYLFLCYGFTLLTGLKRSRLTMAAGTALSLLLICTWWGQLGGFYHIFRNNDPELIQYKKIRTEVEAILNEYEVPSQSSYFLCIPNYSSYEYFLCQYLLDSSIINNPKVTDPSQLEDAKDYHYMILLEEGNPIIEAWVQEYYPDQVHKRVIQLN